MVETDPQQPEMVKFFTADGEIIVPVGGGLVVPWEEKKAPMWATVLVLLFSAVVVLGSGSAFVLAVARIF